MYIPVISSLSDWAVTSWRLETPSINKGHHMDTSLWMLCCYTKDNISKKEQYHKPELAAGLISISVSSCARFLCNTPLHVKLPVGGKALLLVSQRLSVRQSRQLKSSRFASRIKADEYWSAKEDLFISCSIQRSTATSFQRDLPAKASAHMTLDLTFGR